MPDPVRIVTLVFLVVGVVFLVLGLRGLRSQLAFRRRALRCRGVVTDFRTAWSSGDGAGRLYYPVLAFRTAEGRDVRTESRIGRSWRGYRPGQEVTITYDPRDPRHAYSGSGASALVLAAVFVAFCGLFVTIALGILVVAGMLADRA